MQAKLFFTCLSIIILFGFLIIFVTDKMVAAPPDVILSFDESEVGVDIGPGTDGQAYISGLVKCVNHVQVIVVDLWAEAGDFATSITPSKMTLEPGNNEGSFEIVIKVPNHSSVATYTITAGGTYQTIPGALLTELQPVEAILRINPYMKIVSYKPSGNITGKAGGEVEASMTIRNEGNYDEHFNISLSDSNKLNVKDWEVSIITEMPLLIQENKNQTLILIITIPDDTPEGEYELIMSITAGGMGGEENTVTRYCNINIDIESEGTGTNEGNEEDNSNVDGKGTEIGEGLFDYVKSYW